MSTTHSRDISRMIDQLNNWEGAEIRCFLMTDDIEALRQELLLLHATTEMLLAQCKEEIRKREKQLISF